MWLDGCVCSEPAYNRALFGRQEPLPVRGQLISHLHIVVNRPLSTKKEGGGFNFPAHRNLRVSEGVENLLR